MSKTKTNKSTQSPRRQTPLNTNGTNICWRINSVALVNVIPENQIETRQIKPRITKSLTTLSVYNRIPIPVKGQWFLDISNIAVRKFLVFYRSKHKFSDHHTTALEQTIEPCQEILSISDSEKRNFLNEYKDCFG